MTMRTLAFLAAAVLLAGCAAAPAITVRHRLPHGSAMAVVMFQDCAVAEQKDCEGAGSKASSIFVRMLSQKPGLNAVSLARPVAATAPLSDDAAVAYAKTKGYRYVVNGEVQDFRHNGHLSLHASRAGVSVRLLSTSGGPALATYADRKSSRAHGPDTLLERMAKYFAAAIIFEKKGEREGKFLLYHGDGPG